MQVAARPRGVAPTLRFDYGAHRTEWQPFYMSPNAGTALVENGAFVQFIWFFKWDCLKGEDIGGMTWAVEMREDECGCEEMKMASKKRVIECCNCSNMLYAIQKNE